jgi:hypothetical protein
VLDFSRRPECKTIPAIEIGICMYILIRALITFVVVLLVLYLVNMLPMDGRTKQIVRVIVIIIGVLSLLSYLVNF